ncbi:MAG: YceD family protein [Candidatus Dadabacteria bacterium]
MSNRREFEIAFVGLKPGDHEFNYSVNDRFFEDYGEQDFKNTAANVKLLLEKNNSFMRLRFEIGGKTDVTCDRCSNELPLQLFEEFTVTVKMTDEPEVMNEQEEDPDVFYISRGESHLDVKDWIYEFVNLSIPMQKTCEYENMDGPFCNPAARAILKNKQEEEKKENPLWKGLEKFRDLDKEN